MITDCIEVGFQSPGLFWGWNFACQLVKVMSRMCEGLFRSDRRQSFRETGVRSDDGRECGYGGKCKIEWTTACRKAQQWHSHSEGIHWGHFAPRGLLQHLDRDIGQFPKRTEP